MARRAPKPIPASWRSTRTANRSGSGSTWSSRKRTPSGLRGGGGAAPTGIRIDELLELTQLDLHTYTHPDPAVGTVLLLHVNPSKQDRERMVVVPPELAAVFAAWPAASAPRSHRPTQPCRRWWPTTAARGRVPRCHRRGVGRVRAALRQTQDRHRGLHAPPMAPTACMSTPANNASSPARSRRAAAPAAHPRRANRTTRRSPPAWLAG